MKTTLSLVAGALWGALLSPGNTWPLEVQVTFGLVSMVMVAAIAIPEWRAWRIGRQKRSRRSLLRAAIRERAQAMDAMAHAVNVTDKPQSRSAFDEWNIRIQERRQQTALFLRRELPGTDAEDDFLSGFDGDRALGSVEYQVAYIESMRRALIAVRSNLDQYLGQLYG